MEAFEQDFFKLEHGLGDFGGAFVDGMSGSAFMVEGDDMLEV